MSTLQEMKVDKETLARAVLELINEFQKKHCVIVDDVYLNHTLDGKCCHVRLEVKL